MVNQIKKFSTGEGARVKSVDVKPARHLYNGVPLDEIQS